MTYAHGGRRDIRASFTPYVVAGRVEGYVALVADVSELRAAIAHRDDFISIASHELRTPLAALQLQLDSLARGFDRRPDGWPRDKALGKIAAALRQTDRLTTLVEGLLNVSRLATGAPMLDLAEFDLVGLVEEVADRFAELAQHAGSSIALDLPGPVRGRWDRVRVDHALTNLLSNALKYGPGQPVEISVVDGPELVEVIVRDEGIGIAPEDLGRIFGRFERAVSSRHYGGMGLGLYIASKMITAHGGTIDVHSQLGEGATLAVHLPRHTPQPRAESVVGPRAGSPGADRT
jgi:two-component system OmpR family sensor kinase